MIVQLPVKVHQKFKSRCLDMEVYQGEVVRILIDLFSAGRLNLTDGKIEDVVRTARGIRKDEICGAYNASVHVGVSYQTILRMINRKKLKARKNAPSYGGLIFKKKDLDKVRESLKE